MPGCNNSYVVVITVCLWSRMKWVDTEETAVEEEHVDLFTTPTSKLAAATSDFGYNLFRALAAKDSASNLFLAPTSISEALTQLSMGASEQAQRQLYRALRYHNLLDPQLHNTLRDLLTAIKGPEKGLKTAARIYLSRRLRPKQDFFGVVERQYGVRPQSLTGGAKDLKDINDWVKQQTGNTIARFLAKALPRNAGVNLVGAGFFKGKWVTRFGQSDAMEEFQLDGGATMGIDSDLDCTVNRPTAPKPVPGLVSMFPDGRVVQDLAMTLQPTQVSLKMPALKVSYFKDLLPVLSDLGLSDWLAETNLWVSAPSPHLLFHVNRPFLYLVRDEISGALLVMGRVLNPKDLRK
uniref:Serpin domain-containing protein n=1 Tax=Gadus morhua TaxID=8049 RepID=A0A8C5BD06_GADMO